MALLKAAIYPYVLKNAKVNCLKGRISNGYDTNHQRSTDQRVITMALPAIIAWGEEFTLEATWLRFEPDGSPKKISEDDWCAGSILVAQE